MSLWKWFDDFERDALARGDYERARLYEIQREAYYTYQETDPDRSLALYAEGRELALRLGEPWWVLLCDYWQVEGLLYFKRDYRNVLDLAIRNMLEVRKPLYAQFPFRINIYNNLVEAYLGIDPVGHAAAIQET